MIFDKHVAVFDKVKFTRLRKSKLDKSWFSKPNLFRGDPSKKDGRCYVPAIYSSNHRDIEDLVEYTLMCIDIDDITPDELDLLKRQLLGQGLETLYHTTTRHTPDEPRIRLILEPSRPLNVHEYKIAVLAFGEMMDLRIDKSSISDQQVLFTPLVMAEHYNEYKVGYKAGEPINVDELLANASPEALRMGEISEDDRDTMPPLAPPPGIDNAAWVLKVLQCIDPNDLEYDEWYKVGMAVYHQLGSDNGAYNAWLTWSKRGEKHDETEMPKKWESFAPKKGRRGVTFRAILNMHDGKVLRDSYTKVLADVQTPDELNKITSQIRNDQFIKQPHRAVLATAVRTTHERVDKGVMTASDANNAVERVVTDDERAWADPWWYDSQINMMVNVSTKQEMSTEAFSTVFTKNMPMNDQGTRLLAFDVIRRERYGYKQKTLAGRIYRHGAEPIVRENGLMYLNTFDTNTWVTPDRPFDPDNSIDAEIAKLIQTHANLLGTGRPEIAEFLIQHAAWLRQEPEQRITMGVALTSMHEGVGKTKWGEMIKASIGPKNTGKVNTEAVAGAYNEFAIQPVAITFMEEIEGSVKDKRKIFTRFKDLITSDVVTVRRMHTAPYTAETTTCYMLFSNDPNILDYQATGRRWMHIDVDVYSDHAIEEYLGMSKYKFYSRYDDLLHAYPQRFAAYLDSVDVSEFNHRVPLQNTEKSSHETPLTCAEHYLDLLVEERHSPTVNPFYVHESDFMATVANHIAVTDSHDEYADIWSRTFKSERLLRLRHALKARGYVQMNSDALGLTDSRVFLPIDKKDGRKRMTTKHVWAMPCDLKKLRADVKDYFNNVVSIKQAEQESL